MKKAFYLFISVLLVLFSTNKVNDERVIKRTNEQTNKQEIILIYSSNDFYTLQETQGGQTAIAKVSSTFKISVNRRYIIALRTNNPNMSINQDIDCMLMGYDITKVTSPMNGEQFFNYLTSGNQPQYGYSLNYHFNRASQEGGYFTYYLNLSSFGHNNNINEMYMSILQQGAPDVVADTFIQDIYVYDITYITTQGETWYNYQNAGTDPTEIQTAYDKGYSDAIKSGTGLNWFQSAFNMVTNILNIEILPNIKIAYLVAIPLLIELVLFVLRFIK